MRRTSDDEKNRDDRDADNWGPYENSRLAYLLCSDPRQSLEAVINRLYFGEDVQWKCGILWPPQPNGQQPPHS
jgi:hypothetical protein